MPVDRYEAGKTLKAVEEIFSSLSISESINDSNAAANNLASILNGPVEERSLPFK